MHRGRSRWKYQSPRRLKSSLLFSPLLCVEDKPISFHVAKSIPACFHGALTISASSRGIRPAPRRHSWPQREEAARPACSARRRQHRDPSPSPLTDVTVLTVSHCPSPGSSVLSLVIVLQASVTVLRGLRAIRPLRVALRTEGPGRLSQKSD